MTDPQGRAVAVKSYLTAAKKRHDNRLREMLADTQDGRRKSKAEEAIQDIADEHGWFIVHTRTGDSTRLHRALARGVSTVWVHWTTEGYIDWWRCPDSPATSTPRRDSEGLYEALTASLEVSGG